MKDITFVEIVSRIDYDLSSVCIMYHEQKKDVEQIKKDFCDSLGITIKDLTSIYNETESDLVGNFIDFLESEGFRMLETDRVIIY